MASTNVISFKIPNRATSFEVETCARCQGTGWERIVRGSYSSVRRCTAQQHLRQSLLAAGIPHLYLNCTLEDFAVPSNSIGLTESINEFCVAYPDVTDGFLIKGDPNSGKTHLAVAIMGELMRRNIRGLRFFDTTELLRKLDPQSSPLDKRSRKELHSELESASLIVLDDFGAVTPTESEIEQLDYLVDAHYRAMRPIIITTRHSSDELASMFSRRVISRLLSMTTAVDLG